MNVLHTGPGSEPGSGEAAVHLVHTDDGAHEVSVGRLRFALVDGEDLRTPADLVRISLHRSGRGEAHLRVHCRIPDLLSVPTLLRRLSEQDAPTSGVSARELVRGIADLVDHAYAYHLEGKGSQAPAQDSQPARMAMLSRIKAFARGRLDDPDLKPEMLAQHHHISLRYLQKLFQEHDASPASWIRDERLSRAAFELQDPRFSHLPIAVVGERAGLYGASHFSRLFRARYGVSPREYRRVNHGLRKAA